MKIRGTFGILTMNPTEKGKEWKEKSSKQNIQVEIPFSF